MHDEAWWDGDDERDAIAQLQRVLAPLRETPRPWGDVIAQARFVAARPTRRGPLVGAMAVAVGAALVLGWVLGRRDAAIDHEAALIENVQPPMTVAEPTVVDTTPTVQPPPTTVDPFQALDRSVLELDMRAREAAAIEDARRKPDHTKARKKKPHDDLLRALQEIERGERAQDDDLPETLTTGDIKVAMDRVKPAAKACGKQHGAQAREKVTIKFTIDGTTGRPTMALAQSQHKGTELGRCIEDVVLTAQFPRFRKPSLGVVYPFMM